MLGLGCARAVSSVVYLVALPQSVGQPPSVRCCGPVLGATFTLLPSAFSAVCCQAEAKSEAARLLLKL